jgi:hypothetical protein
MKIKPGMKLFEPFYRSKVDELQFNEVEIESDVTVLHDLSHLENPEDYVIWQYTLSDGTKGRRSNKVIEKIMATTKKEAVEKFLVAIEEDYNKMVKATEVWKKSNS